MQAGAAVSLRAEILLKPLFIVSDHLQRVSYDIRRRTVVRAEKDLLRAGIILPELEHERRICSPESIDRLIVVADYEKIIFGLCQHPYHVILDPVDILELIDQDIAELFLPLREHVRPGCKQFIAEDKHIVEINLPELLSLHFILSVDVPEGVRAAFFRYELIRIDPVILDPSDFCRKILYEVFLVKNFHLLPADSGAENLIFLFLGKNVLLSHPVRPFQDSVVDPVESPGCHRKILSPRQRAEPGFHLRSRKTGKSNDQNFFWPYFILFDKIFNSVYNRERLPRPGACEHETGTFSMGDCFFLCLIESHTVPFLAEFFDSCFDPLHRLFSAQDLHELCRSARCILLS